MSRLENQAHWTRIKSETADQGGFKHFLFEFDLGKLFSTRQNPYI